VTEGDALEMRQICRQMPDERMATPDDLVAGYCRDDGQAWAGVLM
jgi:hypothetical protein